MVGFRLSNGFDVVVNVVGLGGFGALGSEFGFWVYVWI